MSNRLGGKQGTAYTGTNANQPPNWTFSKRDPNEYDTHNITLGDLWLNQVNKTVWVLVSLSGNMESKGSVATWSKLENSVTTGALDTLSGDSGGAVDPDGAANINLISGIVGLSFDGNPGTNTITLNSNGGIGDFVQSVTGNSGGAVSPVLGNLNIVGDGTSITITGNPGTHTLTASVIAGANGVESVPTDSGTGAPIAGVLNIKANTSSQNAGATVSFSASTNTIVLNMTDASLNTILGKSSGNGTLSGTNNTVYGESAAHALTTGSNNTLIGKSSGSLLTTGQRNTIVGASSGSAYTSSESNNILIGNAITGTATESNVLRLAAGTGTGAGQINKAFIHGIRGITPGVGDGILVYVDSNGQLGTVGTGGGGIQTITPNSGGVVSPSVGGNINLVGDGTSITITGNPGTNTLTASLVGGGLGVQSVPTDVGTAIPVAGALRIKADNTTQHAGSTVSFTAASNTVLLNVTDANSNTIIGLGSGNATLSGSGNAVYGSASAIALTSGSTNTVCGTAAAVSLTTGSNNTLVGRQSGNSLTTGARNVLIGASAGSSYVSSESNNICIGYSVAGTTGQSNNLVIGAGTGTGAGQLNKAFISGIRGITPAGGDGIPVYIDSSGQLGTIGTGGGGITSVDTDSGSVTPAANVIAIKANTSTIHAGSSVSFTGSGNTILFNVTDGLSNTIVGEECGNATITGTSNSIFGSFAGTDLTSGTSNTLVGESTGSILTSGGSNALYAANAGELLTTGSNNTLIGRQAGNKLTTGQRNTIIGSGSGANYTSSESSNIIIGNAIPGTTGQSNTLRIGLSTGSGTSQLNKTFIQGIRGITVGAGDGIPVYVDSNGQLGTGGGTDPSGSGIAFSAVVVNQYTVTTNNYTKIEYDYIAYDLDSNFDITTSTFTAPVTGIYNFAAGVAIVFTPLASKSLSAIIVVSNDTYWLFSVAQSVNPNGGENFTGLGNSIYTMMDAGDTAQVFVNQYNAGFSVTYSVRGNNSTPLNGVFNYFSGVLI